MHDLKLALHLSAPTLQTLFLKKNRWNRYGHKHVNLFPCIEDADNDSRNRRCVESNILWWIVVEMLTCQGR